ncbi:MAG: dephospho-CoA kinase [Clostridia bacterium]|nr:dephospho-CoA kinase [Clostridia bacterium]
MKIAVIGGIGSGKSRVIECLDQLGERTCDCDKIYKDILKDREYIRQVGELFGVVTDGEIDKKALAEIVFSDEAQLKKLNALAHPLVFKRVDDIYKEGEGNLYVEVSAFDESMAKYFDEIVYVKSEQCQRVERIKIRNNFEENYILSIIAKQMSAEKMQGIADFVIVNDSTLEELYRQVEYLIAFHTFD